MSIILSKELLRKSIQLAGMLIPVIYYFTDRFTVLFWLVPLVFVTLQLELMRLSGYFRYPAVLLRPYEEHRVAGYIYSITAAVYCYCTVPEDHCHNCTDHGSPG